MDIKVEQKYQWMVISLNGKVDCSNFEEFTQKVDALVGEWDKKVAFDLSQARFLNLPSIQFLANRAETLKSKGGEMALVSPAMKTKRHIEIFASIDNMIVFDRSVDFVKANEEKGDL